MYLSAYLLQYLDKYLHFRKYHFYIHRHRCKFHYHIFGDMSHHNRHSFHHHFEFYHNMMVLKEEKKSYIFFIIKIGRTYPDSTRTIKHNNCSYNQNLIGSIDYYSEVDIDHHNRCLLPIHFVFYHNMLVLRDNYSIQFIKRYKWST